MALVYLFLYAPIAGAGGLSFNASRLSASWEGFTLALVRRRSATNPAILSSLRNSLLVGASRRRSATACGTAAALALHRYRFRRAGLVSAAMLVRRWRRRSCWRRRCCCSSPPPACASAS